MTQGTVRDTLHSAAVELKTHQDQCTQTDPRSSKIKDLGNADAYAVAQIIHEMRMEEGSVPVGRKIGFTNPNIWSTYGVYEPIWGYVYDSTAVRLDRTDCVCTLDRFAEPRIEPEIVLHFRSPPRPTADAAEILSYIDWIAHGFEIVQSHFPGWNFQAADSGLHGMLIVGEPVEVSRLEPDLISKLHRFTLQLSCDGKVRDEGRGSNVLGSPLTAIAHLNTVINNGLHPVPLQADELVTTGTLTAAFPIRPGQCWSTELDGIDLPGLSVTLE